MKEAELIHRLHDHLSARQSGQRSIVQLRSPERFRRFLNEKTRLSAGHPLLELLRPLPLIHGFTCPLTPHPDWSTHPDVLCAEPDGSRAAAIHALSEAPVETYRANRFSLGEQWVPWGVRQIKAPAAWKRSAGNQIKIAVVDTGIDASHPDLRYSTAGGVNFVQRHLFPIDDNGHGTHIAGTIAAASRHAGIIGVAPQAVLYAVKSFDKNGTAFVSDIVSGIEWCIRNRIDIINMSFGMRIYSSFLEEAVKAATREGIVVVASSGNDGKTSRIDYPARLPETVSVGATTRGKAVARFSNQGPLVDIYAPGQGILSTWLHGRYNELSGTSMATSHVTGVIALLLSTRPGLSLQRIKSMLKRHGSVIATRKKKSPAPREVNALLTLKSAES